MDWLVKSFKHQRLISASWDFSNFKFLSMKHLMILKILISKLLPASTLPAENYQLEWFSSLLQVTENSNWVKLGRHFFLSYNCQVIRDTEIGTKLVASTSGVSSTSLVSHCFILLSANFIITAVHHGHKMPTDHSWSNMCPGPCPLKGKESLLHAIWVHFQALWGQLRLLNQEDFIEKDICQCGIL